MLSGRLTVIHLNDAGEEIAQATLDEGQAVLNPRGVWHRLTMDGPCRYLFFGGGRTEIRRG